MKRFLQIGGGKTLLLLLLLSVAGMTKAQTGNINFYENAVKSICVSHWDTNGDGQLSYEEAAAVTSLGTVFKNNTSIQYFPELQYFTGLTAIDAEAFAGCTSLQIVAIPGSVANVGSNAFQNCSALTDAIAESIEVWCGIAFANDAANPLSNHPARFRVIDGSSYPIVTTLTIPEGVTSINDYAFYEATCFTGDLVISNTVTSIGQYAFYGCTGFTGSLTLGNSLTTIDKYAFQNCSGFTGDLAIPNSVTTIGWEAFSGCSGFTGSLTLGNSLTTIDNYAFQNCSGFTGNLVIGNSVTKIGGGAFIGCSNFTGDLTIGDAITEIFGFTFDGCSGLTGHLTLGNSVTKIGGYAFRNCMFTGNLVLPNSLSIIEGSAFAGCSGFTGDLILPNALTKIGNAAFSGCSGFTGNLVIPSGEVDGVAFRWCTGFSGNLIIGNDVTKIGAWAFKGCTGFTGTGCLIIGKSVSSIERDIFEECASECFSKIIIQANTPPDCDYTQYYNAFDGFNYSTPVYVPYGKTSAYQAADVWKDFTTYEEFYQFQPNFFATNHNWSDSDNWAPSKPATSKVVCINDNCDLDENAEVLYLIVTDNSDKLTVKSGKTLTATYGAGTYLPSQLVIEEGGQFVTNIPSKGTVQRHIDAFSSANDGWNFIASPVTESIAANTVSGLIPWDATVYDLYYLDEENTYWRNYKQNAFEINHNQGYLYANGAGTTLNFSGTLQPYVAAGISIPLSNTGDDWNLVGNPFTFNAYANKSYYVINGRNVEAAVSGAIPPCTGIVVKATGDNQTVTFTKNNPAANSNQGNLNIVVAEQVATRDGASSVAVDKAIVSFNEGSELEKFVFNQDNAKLYFTQDGQDYAIAYSEGQGEVPVNFKATKNGEYTITVNSEDVELGYLHLIDNLTGADVDLLSPSLRAERSNPDQPASYTFTAKTTDYASRFRLVFSANGDAEDDDETFAFINNGDIIVNGEGMLQVIDVLGHVCRDAMLASPGQRVSTAGMTPGVYVLRLINGNEVRTQKIVIQ